MFRTISKHSDIHITSKEEPFFTNFYRESYRNLGVRQELRMSLPTYSRIQETLQKMGTFSETLSFSIEMFGSCISDILKS